MDARAELVKNELAKKAFQMATSVVSKETALTEFERGQAIAFLKIAQEGNIIEADVLLAGLYAGEKGDSKKEEAYRLYKKGAEHKHKLALQVLKFLILEDVSFKTDPLTLIKMIGQTATVPVITQAKIISQELLKVPTVVALIKEDYKGVEGVQKIKPILEQCVAEGDILALLHLRMLNKGELSPYLSTATPLKTGPASSPEQKTTAQPKKTSPPSEEQRPSGMTSAPPGEQHPARMTSAPSGEQRPPKMTSTPASHARQSAKLTATSDEHEQQPPKLTSAPANEKPSSKATSARLDDNPQPLMTARPLSPAARKALAENNGSDEALSESKQVLGTESKQRVAAKPPHRFFSSTKLTPVAYLQRIYQFIYKEGEEPGPQPVDFKMPQDSLAKAQFCNFICRGFLHNKGEAFFDKLIELGVFQKLFPSTTPESEAHSLAVIKETLNRFDSAKEHNQEDMDRILALLIAKELEEFKTVLVPKRPGSRFKISQTLPETKDRIAKIVATYGLPVVGKRLNEEFYARVWYAFDRGLILKRKLAERSGALKMSA